jgi:hypothetical protein
MLQTLLAYHSVEYAWNEPMKKKLLAVDAIVSGVAVRVGVFALDKLGSTVIPPMKQLNGKVRVKGTAFGSSLPRFWCAQRVDELAVYSRAHSSGRPHASVRDF